MSQREDTLATLLLEWDGGALRVRMKEVGETCSRATTSKGMNLRAGPRAVCSAGSLDWGVEGKSH